MRFLITAILLVMAAASLGFADGKKPVQPAEGDKCAVCGDIDTIYVTEYYGLVFIDARAATFVVGSDVRGPMGSELIAFENKEDANVFNKDHKGKTVLKFEDITPETLKNPR